MDELNDPVPVGSPRPSATRALRRLNLESSAPAETRALHEMLRSDIDDTVLRAQRQINRERAATIPHHLDPVLVYARGEREVA
jgi:hypothetical protein